MTKKEYEAQAKKALAYYEKANIILNDDEKNNIEVADFGRKPSAVVTVKFISTLRAKRTPIKSKRKCPKPRSAFSTK